MVELIGSTRFILSRLLSWRYKPELTINEVWMWSFWVICWFPSVHFLSLTVSPILAASLPGARHGISTEIGRSVDTVVRYITDSAPTVPAGSMSTLWSKELCFQPFKCLFSMACCRRRFYGWCDIEGGLEMVWKPCKSSSPRMKRIVFLLIRFYQDHAPMRIRACCLHEPSCSEYLILSIEKYGCFSGIYFGVRRILRCRPPFGGVDYP